MIMIMIVLIFSTLHETQDPQSLYPVLFFVFLKANTSVIKLNLADNWIGAEGVGYVAEMLRENCYISDLVCVTCYVLNL